MTPYLLFTVGERTCALSIRHVRETMRPLPVEPAARAPAFVVGTALIRGEPTPIVDTGVLLGDGPIARPTRLVAVRIDDGRTVGLLATTVLGMRTSNARGPCRSSPTIGRSSKPSAASITSSSPSSAPDASSPVTSRDRRPGPGRPPDVPAGARHRDRPPVRRRPAAAARRGPPSADGRHRAGSYGAYLGGAFPQPDELGEVARRPDRLRDLLLAEHRAVPGPRGPDPPPRPAGHPVPADPVRRLLHRRRGLLARDHRSPGPRAARRLVGVDRRVRPEPRRAGGRRHRPVPRLVPPRHTDEVRQTWFRHGADTFTLDEPIRWMVRFERRNLACRTRRSGSPAGSTSCSAGTS